MNVFISWSGPTAKAVAELIRDWLPNVLQAAKPFFSPDDISKGARWSSDVAAELQRSQVGLIVVTSESVTAPWIMFEAGALSKNVGTAKVVPILYDLAPGDLHGPLTQFQCARIEKSDFKRLVRMLNSELGDRSLSERVLESVFEVWWAKLESEFRDIARRTDRKNIPVERSDRELLIEVLGLTKSIAVRQGALPHGHAETADTRIKPQTPAVGHLTVTAVQKRLQAGGDLVGANLMGLNLAQTDFTGAQLQGASLVKANLSGAKFFNANLDGANLERARLDESDMAGATISRVNLWRASMMNVQHLASVKTMEDANFFDVKMTDSDRQLLRNHQTIDLGSYEEFFAYYRSKGLSDDALREIFLWTAHSYPGKDVFVDLINALSHRA